MSTDIDNKAFDDVRALAHRLDLRLGTERRKLILVGHERLTLTTKAEDWENWRNGVEYRLKSYAGEEATLKLLLKSGS